MMTGKEKGAKTVSAYAASVVAFVCALCAAIALMTCAPTQAFAGETWTYSKSKTATNLDENFESQVTLSLPSAQEQLVSDVVFVVDESSCSAQVKTQVADLLKQLYAHIEGTDASIKVGMVQFRGEVTELPLTELSASTKDEVTKFMGERPETGGSNMSAGLLAGKAMLDGDSAVDNSRKYLILVSDGITYIWDDESTAAQENYGVNFANGDTPNKPMRACPDGWDVKYSRGYVPNSWSAWLDETADLVDKTIEEKASRYDRNAAITDDDFVAYGEKDEYASTVDIALYKSYQAYQSIAAKYNTFVVVAGESGDMNTYPFGPSFMKYLGGDNAVSFEKIQNEIYYLLDAGSTVKDYMGYVAGENGYNFDFVNDASALTLKVGNESYAAEPIAENEYGFAPAKDGYLYTVKYVPGNLADEEHFVWTINTAVSNFAPVQLTYSVVLTNPQTEAGTYGTFDADGSEGYKGLYTNNSATLVPVDTNGEPGAAEDFAKPTVSYTVEAAPVVPGDPTDEPTPGNDDKPTAPVKETVELIDDATTLPATGDSLLSLVPFVVGIAAACAAVGVIAFRRARF